MPSSKQSKDNAKLTTPDSVRSEELVASLLFDWNHRIKDESSRHDGSTHPMPISPRFLEILGNF